MSGESRTRSRAVLRQMRGAAAPLATLRHVWFQLGWGVRQVGLACRGRLNPEGALIPLVNGLGGAGHVDVAWALLSRGWVKETHDSCNKA